MQAHDVGQTKVLIFHALNRILREWGKVIKFSLNHCHRMLYEIPEKKVDNSVY